MSESASAWAAKIADTRARADELAKLVDQRLPLEVAVAGDHDAWPLIGPALLSRATTTLRHVMTLSHDGQALDAGTLGRSLYEHVVHLAWLGADPSADRIEKWRLADLRNRLKADAECGRIGVSLLTLADRAEMEAEVGDTRGDLNLADLAVASDQHWAGKLPKMGAHTTLYSFRGMYSMLYRQSSSWAHPSFMGLNAVVEDVAPGRQRILIEQHDDERHWPFGMSTVIFGLGLYIAAATLGWPDADGVSACFERHPGT